MLNISFRLQTSLIYSISDQFLEKVQLFLLRCLKRKTADERKQKKRLSCVGPPVLLYIWVSEATREMAGLQHRENTQTSQTDTFVPSGGRQDSHG